MILEEETFKAFGYYPSKLKPYSNKSILAACELCGKFKVTTKDEYHTFCNSCSQILGGKSKGKNNPMSNKNRTEDQKTKQSVSVSGENNPFFKKPIRKIQKH